MNKLLVVFLLFSLIIFIRPGLFGLDSYYYVAKSCDKIQDTIDFNPPEKAFNIVFWQLIPCDLLAFKALICLVFGICLLIMLRIARLFDQKNAEIYTLVFFLNPFLLQYFGNMENDLIAAPFLFLSLFFLLRYCLKKNKLDYGLSLLLAGLGVLIWKQMALWLILILTVELIGVFFAIILFIFIFFQLFNSLDYRIMDNTPGIGLLGAIYLLFGIKDTPKPLFLPVVLSLIFGFIALKFAIFAGILLVAGAITFIQRKQFLEKPIQRNLIFGILFLFFIFQLPNLYFSTPNQETIDSIHLAIIKANGSKIENDFWVGYMVLAFGGETDNFGGLPDPLFKELKGIKITEKELPCSKFGEIKEGFLISEPKIAYLYDCG